MQKKKNKKKITQSEQYCGPWFLSTESTWSLTSIGASSSHLSICVAPWQPWGAVLPRLSEQEWL